MSKKENSIFNKYSIHNDILNEINNSSNIKVYETNNSSIIFYNNNIYGINNFFQKKISCYIYDNPSVYLTNSFYVIISKLNNKYIITYIDEYFKTTYITISFNICNVYTDDNYIILFGETEKIFINKHIKLRLDDYVFINLFEYIIFYNKTKSNCIIIDSKGFICNKKINQSKLKNLSTAVETLNGIEPLIQSYVNKYIN